MEMRLKLTEDDAIDILVKRFSYKSARKIVDFILDWENKNDTEYDFCLHDILDYFVEYDSARDAVIQFDEKFYGTEKEAINILSEMELLMTKFDDDSILLYVRD